MMVVILIIDFCAICDIITLSADMLWAVGWFRSQINGTRIEIF